MTRGFACATLLLFAFLFTSPAVAEPDPAPAGSVPQQPGTVTLVFKDSPVQEVLKTLFATQDKSVTIDPCVKGTVSVELRNVDFRTALQTLSLMAKFSYGWEGERYWIDCDPERHRPLPVAGEEARRSLFDRSREKVRAIKAAGARDAATCLATYVNELKSCHATYGPPLAPPAGTPRRKIRIDPLPSFCITLAKEVFDACLGFDPQSPDPAGRVRLNGRNVIQAHSISTETAGVVTYPFTPPKGEAAWILHLANGFPDDVAEPARCRVAGWIRTIGSGDIARNAFNPSVFALDVPVTFRDGANEVTFALDRVDSRDDCEYGFVVAWLERAKPAQK